ncbi:MarR family transcriptional regulator [Gimesia sp.]|uniref:MarR family winged helix-turn-helix transcriptional regulator n=1 Tax=Gimesia sp. TaxID=2024833 RepID=UPI000C5F7D24|nr:MarR family transcriptional regulator [Gimesia sp.]MAX36782.1 MarR family transcriptional regulator [Gimesia sp.]HAH45275.1 MarR family transcriptional regulator [Planctomycetaceae bacterium]|tara:strand:- start:8409 stop:8912 length:504 start_codon:yes stop_codon:yes gene_type:complete
MNQDIIDRIIAQWESELPGVDASCMGIVGRTLRLAGYLERRADEALDEFGIAIWAFDVLGALRRNGKPFSMTPTELMKSVMLSSGAMTNRLDRLETNGLIQRIPDTRDRRSLQVRLTAKGRKIVDAAAPVRFDEARNALGSLSRREQDILASLLRKVLQSVEGNPKS